MPVTRTETGFARSISIGWKGFGRCCASGCARIGASRKTNCPFISASSSSCTMHADAAKPCLAPSSPRSSDEPSQHSGTRQEPIVFAARCFFDHGAMSQSGMAFEQMNLYRRRLLQRLGRPARRRGKGEKF